MHTFSYIWHQRALVLMALASVLSSLSFTVPVSTLYLLARGLTYTEVFTLETVLVSSMILSDLPTGRLADLTGDRAVLVSGYLVGAAASIGFAASTGFPAFLGTSVLSGVGIALISGADRSYLVSFLGDQAEQRLVGVLGHFGALELLAGAAAGILGGLLAAHDLSWAPVAEAVAETAGAAVVLGLPRCPRAVVHLLPTRESWWDVARQIVTTPVLWLSALQPWILVGAAMYLNQPRWEETGIDIRCFGIILAAAQLCAAAGSQVAESLSRRLGSASRFVAITTMAIGVGFILMALPHWSATVAGFGVVLVASALRAPVAGGLVAMTAPGRTRATTLSTVSTCSSLIGVGVNPLIGVLSQHSVILACWVIAGVLVLFGLAWDRLTAR